MRLDLFLKASRLCQRRSVAQRLCDAGLVLVNDKPAKPAHTIKPGDEVSVRRRVRLTRVRVLALPASRQTSRQQAKELCQILSDESLSEDQL